MSGFDQYLLILSLIGLGMIPVGLWMKHRLRVLDRLIDEESAQERSRVGLHPAE